MDTKTKDVDYEYLWRIRKDLLKFLELARKMRFWHASNDDEHLRKMEDMLGSLLGYDEACD